MPIFIHSNTRQAIDRKEGNPTFRSWLGSSGIHIHDRNELPSLSIYLLVMNSE